jgi:hypothetical protein
MFLESISKMHVTPTCGVAGWLKNAHILACMLRFFGGRRFAFGRKLLFLR